MLDPVVAVVEKLVLAAGRNMHRIALAYRVELVVEPHLAVPAREVVQLLRVFVRVVVTLPASLHHLDGHPANGA